MLKMGGQEIDLKAIDSFSDKCLRSSSPLPCFWEDCTGTESHHGPLKCVHIEFMVVECFDMGTEKLPPEHGRAELVYISAPSPTFGSLSLPFLSAACVKEILSPFWPWGCLSQLHTAQRAQPATMRHQLFRS